MSYQSLLKLDSKDKKPKSPKGGGKKQQDGARKRRNSVSPPRNKPQGSHSQKNDKKCNYDIPDRSFGDLYCPPCDAHMNSEGMWESHIRGKKHLKHAWQGNKNESKFEYIDEHPEMQPVLDTADIPITGLHHLCEIQRNEQKSIYQCFLCSSNLSTAESVIEHLAGIKHRMAYLKEHDKSQYELLTNSNMRKGLLESVVEEHFAKHEEQNGRGRMRVRREKPKDASEPPLKAMRKNEPRSYDNDYRPPPSSRPLDRERSLRDRDWIPDKRPHPDRMDRYPDDRDPYPDSRRRYPDERDPHSDNRPRYPDQRDEENYWRESRNPPSPPYVRRSMSEDDEYARKQPRVVDLTGSPEVPTQDPRHGDQKDSRYVDLREMLDRRKLQEHVLPEPNPLPAAPRTAPALSEKENMDLILSLMHILPTAKFLQLTLFKLDNISVKNEYELDLLQKLMNKTTSMCLELKEKQMKPILRAKFEQSMLLNGVTLPTEKSSSKSSSQNHIDQLVEFFKSQSSAIQESKQEQASRSAPKEIWERLPTTTPFQLTSDPTPIPGLSMTEERPTTSFPDSSFVGPTSSTYSAPPPHMEARPDATMRYPPNMNPPPPNRQTTPFQKFANATKDIFGNYPVMNRQGDRYR